MKMIDFEKSFNDEDIVGSNAKSQVLWQDLMLLLRGYRLIILRQYLRLALII